MFRPWCIKIELTEGCNRRCGWCGAASFPKGKYRFMTMEVAEKISVQLGWWIEKPRVEMTLCGEPTLNPNALGIIEQIRQRNKKAQIMLTTNGSTLKNENIVLSYFKSGLNILIVDTYYPERNALREKIKSMNLPGITVSEFGEIIPWKYISSEIKHLILMDDLRSLAQQGEIRKSITNHAGSVDLEKAKNDGVFMDSKNLPLKKKCVYPFREMVIKHDGKIGLCCDDYRRKILFGDIQEKPMSVLWNSRELNAVRSLLYRRIRNFSPCSECNYFGGFRQGLISDPFKSLSNDGVQELFDKMRKNEILCVSPVVG